ncbi:DUF4435 domain-containing protein [Streptococcus halitosis]|uniref:DUF4435 domain-containing protein n=1 Tax=Streptococcus halitosis TaxID=2172545 RepID=UPI0022E5ABB1|nr:DUF4435 domain-containing protein [Streptococcus halitosis]
MKSVTIKNHQESLKEPSVVWEKYTRDVKNNPNRYFVFYEGKDRQYYDCRIQQFAENFNTYEVGGKSKVLELVNKFTHEEGYKLKNKLFFIDKDYGHHQVNSDIYMTPKYAVENFYVSSEAIKRILKVHFGINDDDPEFGRVLGCFNARYREFIDYLTEMNLWAICCNLNDVQIDFDLLGLKSTAAKFLRINYSELELLVEDISFSYFESMYEKGLRKKIKNSSGLSSRNYNLDLSDYMNKKEQIRITFESPLEEYRRHIDEYSRGKQLLWFLKEFLLSVTRKEGGILKNQFLIDDKNIMTVFTNCADTPEGLNEYLRRKCCLIFN